MHTMMRLLLVVLCAIVAAQADDGTAVNSTPAFDNGEGTMMSLARCLLHARKLDCAERRANTALRKFREEEEAVETSRSAAMADLEKQLADSASDIFSPEGKSLEAEGRGKHKKKIHKLIALIKIVILIVVVKLKMVFLMIIGQTLFQFKIALFTFIIMAIKKWKLYQEWKHSKLDHKPVVYYEHAQHQHHYDESDHFHDGLGGLIGGSGHFGKEVEAPSGPASHGGGWGGFWGKRSYASPHDVAYGAYAPVPQGASATASATPGGEKPHFG